MIPDLPVGQAPGSTPAGVVESHSSIVFFVGDRAYKLKKPIDLGFLDFTTVAARRVACHREVELNRRLSPDVYLGVADVVAPSGEVGDHLVVMRRLPDDRRLSDLVAGGASVDEALRQVARQLAVLHAASPTSAERAEIAEVATPAAVAANWQDNFSTIERFIGSIIEPTEFRQVRRLVERYLAGRDELFLSRIRTGQVRDGHGDLRAQDIFCLDDGPRILDCLEFDDRYRFGDVVLDAAFLAMDLERLGHPQAADRFMAWYQEFSDEHHTASLTHHYVAYRAHVRAKVSCLRAEQGDAAAATEAAALHRLVLERLQQGRVVLTVVGGLAGTGKSTVAGMLAASRGWACLRSDELRKDLAHLGHDVDMRTAYGRGLYRPDLVDRVYEVMLDCARLMLVNGQSVVLDASWTSQAQRGAAAALAEATASDFVQLNCTAPTAVAHDRLRTRTSDQDPSDATPQVHDRMAERADPWPTAVQVDTTGPIGDLAEQVDRLVRARLEELDAAVDFPMD